MNSSRRKASGARKDYLWLTERTNWLVEYTGGNIEVLPMPTDKHQSISRFLLLVFLAYITPRGGVVQYSPPCACAFVRVHSENLI